MSREAKIVFKPLGEQDTALLRELDAKSELALFIDKLRAHIGKPPRQDKAAYRVTLYRELPRQDGQTVLRNRRLIAEKLERITASLAEQPIKVDDLKSYGIVGKQFLLYLSDVDRRSAPFIVIAQYQEDINAEQAQFLKRVIQRLASEV
jgi:hypothetical protein